jgi:hypothetical protein
MSINIHRYGSQAPIYFKITLSGLGVTGLTFLSADIQVSKDGAAFANIGTACNNEAGNGVYSWIPAAGSWTQCEVMAINIKATTTNIGAFDENCLIIQTGGDASARLDAT